MLERPRSPRPPVPFWQSCLVCGAAVAAVGYVRLIFFPGYLVPLAYGLPLLLCLWNRDKLVLVTMAAVLSIFSVIKVFGVMSAEALPDWFPWIALVMMMLDIWIMAWVIASVIDTRVSLEERNDEFDTSNVELQTLARELAAREEETSLQNDQLQAQAAELEQKAGELRVQSESFEAQGEQLRLANLQLSRRQRAMQLLFQSARSLDGTIQPHNPLEQIAHVAVESMEGQAAAATVIECRNGQLILRGHSGFGDSGPGEQWALHQALANGLGDSKMTSCLEDLSVIPQLVTLQPQTPDSFKSVIVSPLIVDGTIVGALEIFGNSSGSWNPENFQMSEWLAAQASLLLETLWHQEEVERRSREAEESSIRKTRFLAAVSHDVRTPANSISLIADLIERVSAKPEQRERVPQLAADLKRSAKLLVELVSDVLDLARFDSGRIDITKQTFGLLGLIETEVQQHRLAAQNKGLELRTTLPTKDKLIATDKLKLSRVLSNLIGNAVKFTETGHVTVAMRDTAEGEIAIDVHDTGIGIAPEHLPRIFDEFFQLRNPERDRSKGTGLGLAICKRLADGIGCALTVSSTVGRGSTFTVTLPRLMIEGDVPADSLHGQTSEAAEARTGDRRLRGLRIVLVEDHDVTRNTLKEILEAELASVTVAANGRSAIDSIIRESPHVVLLDLMLPDMDGAEVLREINTRRPASLQAILVISGDVNPQRTEEVRNLGADALLGKPVNPGELITTLNSFRKKIQSSSNVTRETDRDTKVDGDTKVTASTHEKQAKPSGAADSCAGKPNQKARAVL